MPFDQQFPIATAELSTQNTFQSWQQVPILNRRHGRRSRGEITPPLLEQANMKNVMETCTFW